MSQFPPFKMSTIHIVLLKLLIYSKMLTIQTLFEFTHYDKSVNLSCSVQVQIPNKKYLLSSLLDCDNCFDCSSTMTIYNQFCP